MNLIESPEAFEALDVVLAQIMSKDAAASTLALSQIDELIKDKEKVVLLAERIDQVLRTNSFHVKEKFDLLCLFLAVDGLLHAIQARFLQQTSN